MRLSQIKKAQKNIEEGAWVRNIPNLPGVSLKVRGQWSTAASLVYAEAKLSMSDEEFKTDKVQEELDIRVMAECLLLDWDGIQDDTKKPDKMGEYPPLPFDVEVAKKLLADPEMILLRSGVRFAAANVATLGRENLESAAKN